jgi:fatty-acid desaturase
MFQMQIYITLALLLHSGAVNGGLENILVLTEFIVDIYQQFPQGCVFIINSEAHQQGENNFISFTGVLCSCCTEMY